MVLDIGRFFGDLGHHHHILGRIALAQRRTEDHHRDHAGDVRVKDVAAHTGHVAHIVAHVVGDGRRVARVILRNALFHLAHQVGSHIRRLGVDSTPDPGEQCL